MNICSRCRRYVFQPEEKNAFGKVWHSFCFSCYICNKLLDCTNVQITKDDLYCTDCFFRLMKVDDDDQCPSEQCIRSLSSRVRSTDDLKAKYDTSDVESNNEVIYPCTIPVPYSVSAWYNRQHQRRLLPMKQAYRVPSYESGKSATGPGYKAGQESECTCAPSPSYPPPSSLKEIKPDTTDTASGSSKKSVNFERSSKEQKQNTDECCQSKVSAASSLSSRHSRRSDESYTLKQRELSSITQNIDCHCSSFKPIEAIKAALQQSVRASLEPKRYHCINTSHSNVSPRSGKYGRHPSLGGGLDCRRLSKAFGDQ